MFGIRGLDPFGALHAALGLAAVGLGLGIVLLDKGTLAHRRVGMVYAVCLLLLDATVKALRLRSAIRCD